MAFGFRQISLAATFTLCGTPLISAASTLITFRVDMSNQIASATFVPGINAVSVNGTFNGWGLPNGIPLRLTRAGDSTIYTNTINDTMDPNDGQVQYKFIIDVATWETTATGHNRASRLPATPGESLVLPTPYFSDAGRVQTNMVTFQVDMSRQIQTGAFDPSSHSVSVRGTFNNWGTTPLTRDSSIVRTNSSGVVTSNVYVGAGQVVASPNAPQNYKFYFFNGADQWDVPNQANRDDSGNRFCVNATEKLQIVSFSDDSEGTQPPVTAPTSLGEAGRILPAVPVRFTHSILTPPDQALYVLGDLPQLGAWDPTKAVRMISTNCAGGGVCDWQVTVGLPEGIAYEYKFILRNECLENPACYGDPANGFPETGPNRQGATPQGLPAPYAGKTVFYYSSWTNVWVVYSNHVSGWTTDAMIKLGPGRFPGESKWRATGLNRAGDKLLYFTFANNSGGIDKPSGVAGGSYQTPLDAFVVQDGQLYNYWPPPVVSNSRIETFFLSSTNLAGRMVRIYVPRGYDQNTNKRYPVLYIHDGQNLFQGMGSFGSWNSDKNADHLIRFGQMREMIIVGLDNTPDRLTDYLPDYCGGNAHKYASLLLKEVKTRIDSSYRTLPGRENTATMGSSMGGLVSFYLGWEYNQHFSKIAPMSAFFPACLQTKLRLGPPFPKKSLRIYMDSGTTDSTVVNDDAGNNIEARDLLVKNGFILNDDLLHVIGYGHTHNERWWDYRTPFAWTFLFPATEEPNTVLDSVLCPRITDFRLAGASNTVIWTSYMARKYTVEGCTNQTLAPPVNWQDVFTTPTPETRPWNYISAEMTNSYHFIRVLQHTVPNWAN